MRAERFLDPKCQIQIDRSRQPIYPSWVTSVIHPELEFAGPATYHLSQVKWFRNQSVHRAIIIYNELKRTGKLSKCLNLQDAQAICKIGPETFRRVYPTAVFFWASVVQNESGKYFIPYLHEKTGIVELDWSWLDADWSKSCLALHFT